MIFVTCIISSNEWIKLHDQGSRSWPDEELSCSEAPDRSPRMTHWYLPKATLS
jgi:hypothetical protein